MIVYEGPSQLNGKPIVAILTNINNPSVNTKTGDMAQLTIMPKGIKHSDAVKTGEYDAVCGDCNRRPSTAKANGLKPCYVNPRAPNSIHRAYERGSYNTGTVTQLNKPLRLGMWGDPAAIPYDIVKGLADSTSKHTGYTHRWREFPEFNSICMASVDTEAQRLEAKALGFRCYRVRDEGAPLMEGEIDCPESDKSRNIQCADCGLCAGMAVKAKDISIVAISKKKKL